MKIITIISIILVLFALIFPIAASWNSPKEPEDGDDPAPAGDGSEDLYYIPPYTPATNEDADIDITLLTNGELRSLSMREYLLGAVAAEMPASFETEALRAQAVALRTYLMRKLSRPSSVHPEADICSDSSCCAAWRDDATLREKWGEDYDTYAARIQYAVESTDGIYITYEDAPIQAVFHSSSAGRTEDSAAIWPDQVPYLVSVASPETEEAVPNYITSVTVAADEFRETVLSAHPEAEFPEDITQWIGEPSATVSGRLASVPIGGAEVKGTEFRKLFGLRSTAITFEVDPEAATVTMTATGYGHGVGMSQYGAQTMAKDGAGFEEILSAYYPGTELVKPEETEDSGNS